MRPVKTVRVFIQG